MSLPPEPGQREFRSQIRHFTSSYYQRVVSLIVPHPLIRKSRIIGSSFGIHRCGGGGTSIGMPIRLTLSCPIL